MKQELADLIGSVEIAENLLAHYSSKEIKDALGQCNNDTFRRLVPRELAPYVFANCIDSGATFVDHAEQIIGRCAKMRRLASKRRVRQHTVSRFYLENFATHADGGRQRRVHTYRKGRYIGEVGLSDASVRKNFYSFRDDAGRMDNSAEVGLSIIETVGAEVIAKVVRGERLSEQEHFNICYFTAVTWARTPQYREKVVRHINGTTDAFLRNMVENEEQLARNLEKHNRANNTALTLSEIKEEILRGGIKVAPNDAMILATTISRAENLIPPIDATNWLILDAPAGAQFVTSDVPVVLHSAIRPPPGQYVGWGTPQLEATFPLSDRVCLMMTHDYRGDRIGVDVATVDEVCRRTVENCHECTFAKRHDERLVKWFGQLHKRRDYFAGTSLGEILFA